MRVQIDMPMSRKGAGHLGASVPVLPGRGDLVHARLEEIELRILRIEAALRDAGISLS
jgi:hypothetical protein